MGTAGALDPVQVRAHARQAPWQDRARAGEVGRQATGLRYRPHGVLVDPVERGLFADHTADEIVGVVRGIGEQDGDRTPRVRDRHHAVALEEIGVGEIDERVIGDDTAARVPARWDVARTGR